MGSSRRNDEKNQDREETFYLSNALLCPCEAKRESNLGCVIVGAAYLGLCLRRTAAQQWLNCIGESRPLWNDLVPKLIFIASECHFGVRER